MNNLVTFATTPIVTFENIEVYVDLCYHDINPQRYLISNFGNIYDKYSDKYLCPYLINSGYYVVSLQCTGVIRTSNRFLLHRLVCAVFNQWKQPYQNTVNHNNCCKTYNNVYNLSWMSQAENNAYKFETKTDNVTGEKNYKAKITNKQAERICELLEKNVKYRDILKDIGIDNPDDSYFDLITNIKRKIAWKEISDKYNFDNISYNKSNYTNAQIEIMCKMLEDNLSYADIYKAIYNKEYTGSKVNKSFYEFVRKLKNGQQFTEISCKYNINSNKRSTTIH